VIARSFPILAPFGLLLMVASAYAADVERFVDSDEAKEKAYRQGCAITDYRDLVAGDGIDWVWVSPTAHVGAPGAIELKPIHNYSDVTDPDIGAKVEKDFRAAFERIGKTSGKGGLVATACVFWMDRFDTGRAMVPFAGAHLMQAGIGIEVAGGAEHARQHRDALLMKA
jgi:hypothetical protein